ncbi:MAG: tRNA (adenosine(37)-N6)-threonylcarbamoyltransferase complex ATPase subunit type 1 TsaE, partial [Bacteroidetes bacterium]
MKSFHIQNEEQLSEVSDYLLQNKNELPKSWLFYGEMGAGKTTLIKNFCAKAGVFDNVTSPTFSLVNEYLTENDETIYHFDFYRIE